MTLPITQQFTDIWTVHEPALRDNLSQRLAAAGRGDAPHLVNDALQQTYTDLLGSGHYKTVVRAGDSAFAYLRKCCRNTLTSILEKASREEKRLRQAASEGRLAFPTALSHEDPDEPPEDGSERKTPNRLRPRRVFRTIRSALTEQEFSVFRLYFVDGHDAVKVASMLSMERNNVYQIAWRVSRKLEALDFPA